MDDHTDSLFFITNRHVRPLGGHTDDDVTSLPPRVSLDEERNFPSPSVHFCIREGSENYLELGNETFFKNLKDHPAAQVLLYIHGFSNLPEPDIFPRALELQKGFDSITKGLVLVVPLVWPCDNDFGM